MTAPPDIDAPAKRNRIGWALLALVGIPLLVLAVTSFFFEAYSPTEAAQSCIEKLRQAAHSPRATSQAWAEVDQCVTHLRGLPDVQEVAAMVAVAAAGERHRRIALGDLDTLAKSRLDRVRAFGEVYAASRLSSAEARGLLARMRHSAPIYRISRAAARRKAGLSSPPASATSGRRVIQALLEGAAIGAIMLGLAIWVFYLGFRSRGLLEPLGHPAEASTPVEGDVLAIRSAQCLLAYLGIGLMLPTLSRQFAGVVGLQPTREGQLVVVSLATLLAFSILAQRPIGGRSLTLADVGLGRDRFWRHVGWGVAGLLANAPIMVALTLFSQWAFAGVPEVAHPVLLQAENATSALTVLLLTVNAALLIPFIEEVWFRGTLLPALSWLCRGRVAGVVVTSLLFALLHPTGLHSWLPLASIGAMAAMLTYQTRSLVPAIVLHALQNGFAMLVAVLSG